jgi:enoyl-CoA hydratase/carnithine racemase
MATGIDVARHHGVVTITFNRPAAKNAITPAGWSSLKDALASIRMPTDRLLVLTGRGNDFSSGNDVLEQSRSGLDVEESLLLISEVATTLLTLPVPSIARVDGVAAGAGMNLAVGCDFVICTPEARFSQIFVKRALSPDLGGSWLLPRLIGLRAAKELALLGEFADADRALDLGLVNRVVPRDHLDESVEQLARSLLVGAPLALKATKSLLHSSQESTLAEALERETTAQLANARSRDALEAARAFRERRPPCFEGL